jgi:hypothetical protein
MGPVEGCGAYPCLFAAITIFGGIKGRLGAAHDGPLRSHQNFAP